MLEPKEIQVTTQSGATRTFIISKFPAIAGREIIASYPLSSLPKVGDYKANEETMVKLMAFVGAPQENGSVLQLSTRALIDNHVPDWETLARLEMAMLEYNTSFFANGAALTFFADTKAKVQAWITKTLTDSLAPSLNPAAPATKNSKRTTR